MSKTFYIFFLAIYLNFSSIIAQQPVITENDRQIVTEFLNKSKSFPDSTNLLVNTALYFLGKPYKASTLELYDKEQLIINVHEFDCMTFVENCIALYRTINDGSLGTDVFCNELQKIRYRNGVIADYPSRLHYTTDWITNNTAKGILSDKTKELDGKPFPVDIYFMSTHPGSYASLKKYPEQVGAMQEIEKAVNQRSYYYIPKAEIKSKEHLIKDGDIVCFTTSIKGLDISHLGIAYRKNGLLTFIHASSNAGKVIINPESIADYCAKIKSNTGIIVLELKR